MVHAELEFLTLAFRILSPLLATLAAELGFLSAEVATARTADVLRHVRARLLLSTHPVLRHLHLCCGHETSAHGDLRWQHLLDLR
jgi:hypothetical protein